MERVPITLFLPNYRNRQQPYLSELIWIKIFLFGLNIPNQLREKDKTKLFQVFPQGYYDLGTGIFFQPDSLFPSLLKP